MFKLIIPYFLAVVASIALVTAYFMGAFEGVQMGVGKKQGALLIFAEHAGPYHEINKTISKVEGFALHAQLPCSLTFGEYLDDPELVDPDRLRSYGGCYIEGDWGVTKEKLTKMTLPKEIQYRVLPAAQYLISKFEGSPVIGPFKVYPKARSWAESKKAKLVPPFIEIYQIVEKRKIITEYLFRLDSQLTELNKGSK